MITYSDPTLGEGTVATYTCNSLYTLNGDSTRTCGSDGSWSGSTPAGCKKNGINYYNLFIGAQFSNSIIPVIWRFYVLVKLFITRHYNYLDSIEV